MTRVNVGPFYDGTRRSVSVGPAVRINENFNAAVNLRFNIIHRPLSDVFLVYNERRDERSGILLSRAVIAKMTYLMAFEPRRSRGPRKTFL